MDPRTTSPEPLISDSSQLSDTSAAEAASRPSDLSVTDGGDKPRAPQLQKEHSLDSPLAQSPSHPTGRVKRESYVGRTCTSYIMGFVGGCNYKPVTIAY